MASQLRTALCCLSLMGLLWVYFLSYTVSLQRNFTSEFEKIKSEKEATSKKLLLQLQTELQRETNLESVVNSQKKQLQLLQQQNRLLKTQLDAETLSERRLTEQLQQQGGQPPRLRAAARAPPPPPPPPQPPQQQLRGAQQPPVRNTVAMVIFTYQRAQYLERCLRSVQAHYTTGVDIFISQDGANTAVTETIKRFQGRAITGTNIRAAFTVQHLRHQQEMRPGDTGYHKLARHFGWALRQLFDQRGYAHVIILEEDLEIAPDFFPYFMATRQLLDQDQSLLCVSAWNDNGQAQFVADSAALYRSDFFPGLGWMLNRRVWQDIGPKWPTAYWDDWLREPQNRKGRHCIRPEVSRSFTFGRNGVSRAQFFDKYLATIKLNDQPVAWASMDLGYLNQARYDGWFSRQVRAARLVSSTELQVQSQTAGDLRVAYSRVDGAFDSYMAIARGIGLMADVKAGVPRTAYKGIVTFRLNRARVFLVPPQYAA